EGLRVVSANGVRPYRDQTISLDRVAADLSVGTVIAGTVGGIPERPLLVIRLIDPVTGQQLDSKRLAPGRGDVLALRNELIREVTVFLRERLGKEIRDVELRAGSRSPQAWSLVHRAGRARPRAKARVPARPRAEGLSALPCLGVCRVAQRQPPRGGRARSSGRRGPGESFPGSSVERAEFCARGWWILRGGESCRPTGVSG